ncbi:MAG: hypothetical protein DRZ90_13435 [Spirochaetes bacterium]|nr:MAG: hypothetical protein DRZ90_13435 [Spirochaetota bacterium]
MFSRNKSIRDYLIIGTVMIVTILAIIPMQNLKIDGSIKAFMPHENEVSITNDLIEDIFGSFDPILVSFEVYDETILTDNYLNVLIELTTDLENFPLVLEIISPVNVDYIESSESGISIVPLMSNTGEALDVNIIKERILSWKDTYVGTIISKDSKLAQIIIRYEEGISPDDRNKLFNQVKALVLEYEDSRWNLSIAGRAVMEEEIRNYVAKDLLLILPLVGILVLLVLFFSFRRWEGVILPFIPLIISVAWIMAGMAIFHLQITLISFLVPILILVVGSAYSIHILSHFYEFLFQNTEFVAPEEISIILKRSIQEVRLSVLLAGLTTGVGFLSFLTSPLGPLREFGLLCTAGVAVSLFVVFIIMPPMIRLRFFRGWTPNDKASKKAVTGRNKGDLFNFFKWIIETKSILIIVLVSAFILFAGYQITNLKTGMNMINFFRPDSKVFLDYQRMNQRMNGTGNVNILIESPRRGDIIDSDFINTIDKYSSYIIDNNSAVTSVQSISQYIKQINKVMNYDSVPYEIVDSEDVSFDFFSDSSNNFFSDSQNEDGIENSNNFLFADENNSIDMSDQTETTDPGMSYTQIGTLLKDALINTDSLDPSVEELIQGFNEIYNYGGAAYNEIPQDPAKYGLETKKDLQSLLSQYLILLAGNLEMVINDDLEPDKTLIALQLNNEEKEILHNVLQHSYSFWDRAIPEGWNYKIGGTSTIYYILDKLIVNSQILSILGALFLVWLIITIIFRSVKVGFIGLIPIVFSLGGLVIAFVAGNLKLDAVTSLTASIAIGVGADYAIHVLVAYRRLSARIEHNDLILSLYSTTGRAILMNAFSVAIGFFALVLSQLIPMGVFGAMFALSMVISSLASLILIPAVLRKVDVTKLFKINQDIGKTKILSKLFN